MRDEPSASMVSRTALVTDGEQRAALAVVRSLGAAGYRCIVTSSTGKSLAGASRYAVRELVVPDAGRYATEHAEAIEAIARNERADLLIPVSESSLLSVLPARERIGARIPFPALETFQAICDKPRVLAAAQRVGVRVPRQMAVRSPAEARGITGELTLPCVLKPHRSVCLGADGRRRKVGVSWVDDLADLEQALAAYPREAFPIMLQEAIVGPGIGIFVLLDEGLLVASFAHRRIREKPPRGGVSVVCQSEPMNPGLLERSLELLAALGWSGGVAMVEYKQDEKTGDPVLMEINGRFWGSLQLAIDAGVDFPGLLAASCLGEPLPDDRLASYRPVRTRWFWGDVDHLLARMRNGKDGDSSRLSLAVDWLRSFGPGHRSEIFRWGDPKPFGRESVDWILSGLRRA